MTNETISRILDGMADLETRLLVLENSIPYNINVISDISEPQKPVFVRVSKDEFDQLKAKVNFLENKIMEVRAKKPKSKYKFTKSQSPNVAKSQ